MELTASNEQDVLETIMDRLGVHGLINTLADIADEKSEHLASNWQDPATAKRWHRVAHALRLFEKKVDDPYY